MIERTRDSTDGNRRLRADAQRNREAILSVAEEVFVEEGVLVPLDTIAMRAGVGNATLYRHFPTRDDLLFAAMEAGIGEAKRYGETLACADNPVEALAEWMIYLAWQLRTWHDLPYCVANAHMDRNSPVAPSTVALVDQTRVLLERAQPVEEPWFDVTAQEIFELVTALSWAIDRFNDDARAARRRVLLATASLASVAPSRR
ncbi:TetR/AcrR family transcriptional regulator [Microbacterium phyllosphaerae]|uniref:TetR/AcrR family transcriptional regulator n=1 Tax=Microbacterium phyllosphaerae TaxID=124798 RepID=UPI003D64CF0F